MLNNYAESGGGFNSNHGQTSRPSETQKQQNISSTWGYNGQLEGMYYGGEHQPMFMGSYEGSTKHSNYSQYPTGSLHQPVPTPVVKCHEACCQHFQDRYPLNPAPLRYQPSGPVQPRYDGDSRQWRSVQPLSRKKVYSTENGYPGIPERHFPQYMGRGQLMTDSRQHMQMMRSQYPMYPPYWGGPRGWTGPRMNCPPPSYHQTVSQGAQLQTGLKMSETHYIDPSTQKTPGSHRRGVASGGGATDVVRPVPEPKRSTLDPNLQSCYEFGYPTGFVPFSEVNKIQSGSLTSQNNTSTCKIPTDKTYHPHQMQYSLQGSDRNMMNCSSSINELSYPMNFPMSGSDSHLRPGLEDNQQITDARKLPLQYDSSHGKKRPDLDLRQYLATWEDDEDESTRLSESIPLGNNGGPYIVVDCRSLEGDAAAKLQERFKTTAAQNCASKQRSSSPNSEHKTDDQPRQDENTERSNLPPEFQSQTSYASSMPALLSDSEKNVNYWNGSNRDSEGIIGKGGAFQPLDCSKRDNNIDPNNGKRDGHPQNDLSAHKLSSASESGTMSFDALVSYYGDNRRIVDGGYDFVEMTERLVNTSEKPSTNIRTSLDHPLPSEISRPCDPRLQQSQLGTNTSIYNKVAPRYPTSSYQHYKPIIPADPYYNYKHSMGTNKYFGYENSQIIDPNYDYHKMPSDFETARLYGSKEISKDPRRMYHQEIEKSVESAFLDPVRKAQIDCFQDKSLEFGSVDHDQFITPIVMKSSDEHNRDKDYSEKNSSIKDRMNILNNENQAHSEKTVLITSQNGPPEIFQVPYSPEKELSHKDNLVTLHSGDQTKSNTITVEVPYDQQYSTLVKLSEEISRSENGDVKSKNKTSSSVSTNEVNNEEFKKPTSFKLKRLPNSKEWTVEEKEYNEPNKRSVSQSSSVTAENSCDVSDDRDALKSSVTVSSLNMPSLDDIRDGDETCEVNDNHPKSQLSDGILCTNKNVCDDLSKTKYNTQAPQMAIVQPMKLNQSEPEPIESSSNNKLIDKNDKDDPLQQPLSSINSQSPTQLNFNPEKSPVGHTHLDLISDSDISKHENFRTHKKIQNSFTNGLPNCLTSPSQDFLHPSNINSGSTKDTYSPFHVYSDCDMNTQITDYFKMDESTNSGEKMLDTRIPSSPGVDGMFEDINHSNQSQLFPQKTCNFQDLTDPNMTSLSAHNAHFQSFSSIFSEDDDKRGRPDGSVLQMGDKKYLKNLLDDIENHHISECQEEQENRLQGNSLSEILHEKTKEVKKSPPIPSISLKLNEAKKMWCIAKKDKQVNQKTSSVETESVLKSIITHSTQETVNEFRGDVPSSIKNEIDCAYSGFSEIKKTNLSELPNTFLPRQLQNNETPEQNLLLDDHRENETSLFSTNNILTPGDLPTTKMCLTITKYYPRTELLKRITNTVSTNLGILVFDENGTHFPKSYDTSGIEVSEKLDICQSITTSIFEKTFDFISLRERNVPNQSSNDSFYHHYNNEPNTAISNNQNTNKVLFTDTVIKFDSSYGYSKDKKDQVNNIVKTTEVFIQREKENSQHHSVIKTTQLQDCYSKIKTRKTSRSIFSPMSDNGLEDDAIFSKKLKSAVHEDIQNENNINYEVLDKDSGHKEKIDDVDDFESQVLDYSSKKSISESTEEPEELSQQLPMNRVTDEVFKGFGSPKEVSSQQIFSEPLDEFTESKESKNSPYHELDKEHSIIKDNLEIDNALELMGLSNTKHSDTASKKYSIEYMAKESSVSLQEALENESDWFSRQDDDYINLPLGSCLQRDNVISNRKEKQVKEENIQNVQCKKNNGCGEITEVKELYKKSNICQDITKVKEASSVVETHTNENLIIFSESQEQAEDLCQTTPQRPKDTLIGFVSENVDLTFSQDMDSSYDLPIENHSQTEGIDSLTHPQSYFSPELGATFNKEESLEAWPIVNTGLLSCSTPVIKDSQADSQIEDFEARLETSVIVRNNNCSSFVYNQSDESCITVCQNPIPSQQVVHLEIEQLNTSNDDDKINLCSTENCQPTTTVLETLQKSVKENPINCINGISEELTSQNNTLKQETHSYKMDCQLETLNYISKTCSTCTESQIENCNSVNRAENINQTPVTTSKDMSISDTINTFKSLGEEDSHMCYCAGESVFMYLDDEVKTYLKRSKASYFHEFKKRKWQKFFKTASKRDISCRYIPENKKDNLSTKVNTNEVFDYKLEKVCTKNIYTETIVENKETKNNPSPVSVEMDSGIEDESHLQYSDSSVKDKSFHSKCSDNPNETSIQLKCAYQSPKQLTFESASDSPVEGRTTLITNTDKASAPLKDKSQFFIEKDSRVFHTRRDSFKMLEPEFVLKEIFSPDPETDDSESKENECPMNFSQIKYDTSPHLIETNLSLTANSISSSLPILSTKFNKMSDCMTSKNPGNLSNTHDLDQAKTLQYNDCNTSIEDLGGKNTIQDSNDPGHDKQVSTTNQVNGTLPLQEEPKIATKDSDEAGGLSSQIISNTQVSGFTNKPFLSQIDSTLENVTSSVIDQGSTISINVINNVENCQDLPVCSQELHNNSSTQVVDIMTELSPCQETKVCKNKVLKKSTPLEVDTVNFSEKLEETSSFAENIEERNLQNSSDIAVSIQSTKNRVEIKPSDDSQIDQTCSSVKSILIQQCHGTQSIHSSDNTGLQETKDKSISLINQDNQTQQIMKFSPRQNCLNNEGMCKIDKENGHKEPLVGSPKDVLISTKCFQDDLVENSDRNSKDDSKPSNVEEEEQQNAGCHDEKINTVQDSLRNSLNNETFPLQCLVEAALALESVDSKQVLFSNSNFPALYSQTEDNSLTFSKITDSTNDGSVKTLKSSNNNNSTHSGENSSYGNHLTPTDREIFSKFEETNYNLRASTRIVTSSSSNIIPYSKRKYGLKSSKISTSQSIKQKKTETSVTDKSRTKKRRGTFTYPRSKRRKKVAKDKQKFEQAPQQDNFNEVDNNIPESNTDVKSLQSSLENVIELNEEINTPTKLHSVDINKCSLLEANYESLEDISKTDFGGPLIIASSNTSTSGNIFCVHVNSNKMDEYVNNLNLEGLEVCSGDSQAFKENSNENSAIVPDVTLENGTSLVIIIEELADTDKSHYIERSKGETDIVLSSIERNCAVPYQNQSISILDDCSDMLSTEFSVNESCVCPPEFNGNSENPLLTGKQDEILESEQFITNSAFEMSDNIEDGYEKFSANCSQELTANCYEEINENLINDIGNWPFVEEEVAEFDCNTDLLNKIPEEGRKIELKCSLPWKKIFNISKGRKKKSKMSRKVSGLELGPAKVEVRLKAPSAEWKVISDYHENDSPVVKVSRLILQRDSDVSSHSEKDSEEENENKRNSEGLEESETNSNSGHNFEKNVPYDENWQPVVILTRNKELDELTLNMELQEHSEKIPSPSITEDNSTATENSEGYSSESASESETNELLNESELLDLSSSRSRENSSCIENTSVQLQENCSKYSSYQSEKTNKVQGYETYSPSARNNELTEETLYSPSDPHFSPDASYHYSDKSCCEDGYDEASSDGKGIYFIANDSVKSNCNMNDNLKDDDENKRNNNEESILRNGDETLGNRETCSQSSNSSDVSSPRSSHTNCAFQFASNLPARSDSDSLPLTENFCNNCNSNEVTLPSNDLQLNVSNREDNETEMSELSRDVIIEQKKKSKRKMPKNFFVRKKLIKKNAENGTEKSSFIENGTHKSEDEVPSYSLLQRLSSDDVTSCSTSDLQRRKSLSSVNGDRVVSSESDLSSVCENSRLQCVYDLEDSSPLRLNESPMSERFEEKVRLRDGGRGLKRPCEGHSKEDTKRRRKKLKSHSSTCEECGVYFKNKEELVRHIAYRHARRRELHHCLLCQRSFSSAARHSRHVQGRSHRHLELTQRYTMHSMHRLLVGGDCPHIAPLSRAELRTLQWRPTQSGYAHFYHEVTPLQGMLQEHSSDTSEDTMSEERMPND